MSKHLFEPAQLGPLTLTNRIVMAPMTRCRALGNEPNELMAEYYRQRATAGLIVAEGTSPDANGLGYARIPGLFTEQHVANWQRVTETVHHHGGHIFLQLMHSGRIFHPLNLPAGAEGVGPSAVAAAGQMWTDQQQMQDQPAPRALTTAEVAETVKAYAHSAKLAMDAGFDGVEVHAANGYLLEQFLRNSVNDRHDAYGGSVHNRTRLLREVMQAVVTQIGAGRTGVRLSPASAGTASPADSDLQAVYTAAAAALAPLKLAFMHVVEGITGGTRDTAPFDYAAMRAAFGGPWMVNNGYTRAMALDAVASDRADLVAFGRPFISNPDLVQRLRDDAPWADSHRATYYGGGAEGYTDYPALHAASA